MSRSDTETRKVLVAARRLLVDERKSQFDSFTMPPHRNTPEAYAAMNVDERRAIKRFDRVIAMIDKATRART